MNFTLLAAATAAFNLNCAGTLETISSLGKASRPYASVYRIDLAANKWCESDCKTQFNIAAVSPAQITLEKKTIDTPRQHETLNNFINRETGDHFVFAKSGVGASALVMNWKGKCTRSDFTGFPKITTQF